MKSNEKRSKIFSLYASGKSATEIAQLLGLSKQLVGYYLSRDIPTPDKPDPEDPIFIPEPYGRDESVILGGLDDPAPVPRSSSMNPNDIARDSLERLKFERDNAIGESARIKASETLLKYAESAKEHEDWTPSPDALKSFITELLKRRPELQESEVVTAMESAPVDPPQS